MNQWIRLWGRGQVVPVCSDCFFRRCISIGDEIGILVRLPFSESLFLPAVMHSVFFSLPTDWMEFCLQCRKHIVMQKTHVFSQSESRCSHRVVFSVCSFPMCLNGSFCFSPWTNFVNWFLSTNIFKWQAFCSFFKKKTKTHGYFELNEMLHLHTRLEKASEHPVACGSYLVG